MLTLLRLVPPAHRKSERVRAARALAELSVRVDLHRVKRPDALSRLLKRQTKDCG
jgi:hypothetical protein